MKCINELDLYNKKVILRLDLNVPIKDGKVLDDTKIRESLETIEYVLSKGSNILIMSHLGKVKSEDDLKKNSLKPVYQILNELLREKVYFVDKIKGEELEESIKNNRITLMENTRYADIPNKSESNCDLELAKYWASLGDIFINDAFGTSHRRHASNYGISKFLETGYGFLIEKEIRGLSPIIKDVKRPFTVLMGGAKVDDKIKLIENILNDADYLLVGGGIANTFLAALGYNVGNSLISRDYLEEIKKIYELHKDKIILPNDVLLNDNEQIKYSDISDIKTGCISDIGKKTLIKYEEIISKSNTLFINGTMGIYEDDRFKLGTVELFNLMRECEAIKIAGGGDAVSSINTLGYENYFDFLSTGGGATLEYIIEKKLKCFEESI